METTKLTPELSIEEELINRYENWLKNGVIYFNPYYPNLKSWQDSVKEKINELKSKLKNKQL